MPWPVQEFVDYLHDNCSSMGHRRQAAGAATPLAGRGEEGWVGVAGERQAVTRTDAHMADESSTKTP